MIPDYLIPTKDAPMEERRSKVFTERLSWFMVVVSACGAFLVLFDPQITLSFGDTKFVFGGAGFSADLKGAVVSLILIGGWTAVKEYWLGSSAGSEKKSEALQKMAQEAPAVAAAVVAAANEAEANAVKGKE